MKSMKILLVQLEVNDHRTLEEIEIEHLIDSIQKLSTSLWFSVLDGDQQNMDMKKEDLTFKNLLDGFLPSNNISSLQYDEALIQGNQQIQEFFEKRIQIIDQKLTVYYKQLQDEDKINKLKNQILIHLQKFALKYQLYGQKSHKCNLMCRLKLNHSPQEHQTQLDITNAMYQQKEYQEKFKKDLINKGFPCQIAEDQLNNQQQILMKLQQQNEILNVEIDYVKLTDEKQLHLDSINKILGIQQYNEEKFRNFHIILSQQCGLKLQESLQFEEFLQRQHVLLIKDLDLNNLEIQKLLNQRYQQNQLLQKYDQELEIIKKKFMSFKKMIKILTKKLIIRKYKNLSQFRTQRTNLILLTFN